MFNILENCPRGKMRMNISRNLDKGVSGTVELESAESPSKTKVLIGLSFSWLLIAMLRESTAFPKLSGGPVPLNGCFPPSNTIPVNARKDWHQNFRTYTCTHAHAPAHICRNSFNTMEMRCACCGSYAWCAFCAWRRLAACQRQCRRSLKGNAKSWMFDVSVALVWQMNQW